jgi:hypothetical protein
MSQLAEDLDEVMVADLRGDTDASDDSAASLQSFLATAKPAGMAVASGKLGISVAEVRCVREGCPWAGALLGSARRAMVASEMREAGWRPAGTVDGAAVFGHTRVVRSAIPWIGAATAQIPLPSLQAARRVAVVPRQGSAVRIFAEKGTVFDTYPAHGSAADRPSDGDEQFTVTLSEDDDDVQVRILAWVLRSEAGHRAYRLSRWPFFPWVLGIVTAAAYVSAKNWTVTRIRANMRASSAAASRPAPRLRLRENPRRPQPGRIRRLQQQRAREARRGQ